MSTLPRPSLGAGIDPRAAVRRLRVADPELAALIHAVGPFRLSLDTAPTAFANLATAIVYQQLSPRAAATIFQRFCAALSGDGTCPTAAQLLAAPEAALDGVGLSTSKRRAIRELAQAEMDGELPGLAALAAMDDAEVIERLVERRGIGRWTAEMFLIFRLGRPDVLPVGDYGLRRGFQIAFSTPEMPSPAEVAARGLRWAPTRTVASWYLWRALEVGR
ncbi:MAG TPA: DNA-3-methyladenine glycosylase 2 family protein [Candidatus Binatia bacterium]|nr:DNA-3-methyladenine glycosylase 2 family protein [Candidatus Binatia bacterium]